MLARCFGWLGRGFLGGWVGHGECFGVPFFFLFFILIFYLLVSLCLRLLVGFFCRDVLQWGVAVASLKKKKCWSFSFKFGGKIQVDK